MGSLVLAAKVTHVPSMFISERDGPFKGCRSSAIEGLEELGRRLVAAGCDTAVVLDTHWLVNSGYHVNTRSHHIETLDVEYGTLVPLHFMRASQRLRVVSIAAWCAFSSMEESRVVGESIRRAIDLSDSRVALLASGSLSHRIHDNRVVEEGGLTISDEFYRQVDLRALDLWQQGRFREFTAMLPTYSRACHGEGWMHDTAMLLGALGWDRYSGRVEILTPYFPSSGTGQVNAVFPI